MPLTKKQNSDDELKEIIVEWINKKKCSSDDVLEAHEKKPYKSPGYV